MSNSPHIQVSENCAPVVAKAIESLRDQWGPYSIESTACSLYSLFTKLIVPAITTYLSALPPNYLHRWIFPNLSFAKLLRLGGFSLVGEVVHACLLRYISLVRLLISDQQDPQFEETLKALRDVARACLAKTPKTTQSDKRRVNIEYCRIGGVDTEGVSRPKDTKKLSASSSRVYSKYCEFCGRLTEVAEKKSANRTNNDGQSKARLSGKYCLVHRPKSVDGARDSHYQWLIRHKADFETELKRLILQARSMSKPNAKTGDPDLDLFYFKVLSHLAVYGSDLSGLRNVARQIVDERVSDKQKRIVMMRIKQQSFHSIAKEVGAKSRQAVFKALKSLPAQYRFDLATYVSGKYDINDLNPFEVKAGLPQIDSTAVAGFIELLGPVATRAFQDSDTVDFGANDNGTLWSESRSLGMRTIGALKISDVEKIIRFAASTFPHEPNSCERLLMVILPFANARFTGILPTHEQGPIFSIRKSNP